MDEVERFRDLFRASYPLLHRYAANRGLTAADADDLVAATLEVAWRRMANVPLDDPVPWLFAVARNLWLNKRRADQRARTLLDRLDTGMMQIDAGEPATDPDVRAIRVALDQLGDADRELLMLIAWDELTPTQAAVVLGCSAVAVRTRLHRARHRLGALLNEKRMVRRADSTGQRRIVPTALATEVNDV